MINITFGYTVGGSDCYYNMLYTALKSHERIKFPYKVVILDADNKCEINDRNIKVIHTPLIDNKIHHYWSNRYNIAKYVDTDYVLYMDVDTVFVNDRIEELTYTSENKFYICQHWWVPYYKKYLESNPCDSNIVKKLNMSFDAPYFASGVFMFNINTCKSIFDTYYDIFNQCYHNKQNFLQGVTDEFILAHTLNITKNYKFCHGSLNHTCEINTMPIEYKDGTLYGKNPFDNNFEKIICLHCDPYRRNPSKNFYGPIKQYIDECFYVTL